VTEIACPGQTAYILAAAASEDLNRRWRHSP
jgi:hypothetical protein